MGTWAAEEMQYAELKDARLNKRLIKLVDGLIAQPNATVPQACGDWGSTKAAYRFWDSDCVSHEAILGSHIQSSIQRVESQGCVLAIQDTTSIDFTHRAAAQGMGPLDHPMLSGLKVHSVLTATTEGVPLGLIAQQVWARDRDEVGKRHTRRKRKTSEKESQKWIWGLEATEQLVGTDVITVADREADVYDFMAAPRRAGHELLVRATHNRRVDQEARYLWEAVRESPQKAQRSLLLNRKDQKPARRAKLSIRYTTLSINPPRHGLKRDNPQPVKVYVILAEEHDAPKDDKPVCWLLITTLELTNTQQALQCLRWYSYRWLIERLHYVLKSGCNLEKLQLQEAGRIQRALATYSIVAWRLLWLTYEARNHPQMPCNSVLDKHEWQSLYCTIHKIPLPPKQPPSLREAVRMIAQLGGFLGRKGDGDPGVKTIWRGLTRLSDIANTWQLLHSQPQGLMGNA